MKPRSAVSVLAMLFAVAVTLGSLGLLAWGLYSLAVYLASVSKEVGAALVAGVATVLAATLTVTVGRYFERKRELDALYREKKLEIYDAFLKQFFTVWFSEGKSAEGDGSAELVPFFQDFTGKLVLWAGPEVIDTFASWKEHLSGGRPDAQSVFLTERFLDAIRKDLRHSSTGLRRGWFARVFLRESKLFLHMASKDPHVTLESLSAAEKYLQQLRSEAADG